MILLFAVRNTKPIQKTYIKSRVNRQSVLGAITLAQQRLKLYSKVPPNGLVLYTGTIMTDEGKEKKFHTEALNALWESEDKFGFIVMDGNGLSIGSVDLPKKYRRGAQSAARFVGFGEKSVKTM
ncbi:hypothetical protein IFM89_035483 [Coptis chinensis]|uniref:eRF1/Pelota-like N-terminal domain-containing protein n=1 Tax=Coptis chinensis TaxID=261450 RepID=A0A835HAH3_9MAGN|nr:hypothetical protein IFM89_035483 [Coptis chinensis]